MQSTFLHESYRTDCISAIGRRLPPTMTGSTKHGNLSQDLAGLCQNRSHKMSTQCQTKRSNRCAHTLRCGPTGLSVCYNFKKNAALSQSVEITEEQSWCKSNHCHLNATYSILRARMSIHQHYWYSFGYFSLNAARERVWVWISMKNETVKMLKWYTQAHAK